MDDVFATLTNDVETCDDLGELQQLKRLIDSLRGTLENRIKTLEVA